MKNIAKLEFIDAAGLLALGGKRITTNGREMVMKKTLYKSGKRKGKVRSVVALYLPSKASQEPGSKVARGRWKFKDEDGNTVTDAQLRERVRRYVAKHPNSNAHDLMPQCRHKATLRNPEGIASNPLHLITAYSRMRFMAQMRRIQKSLAELNRRGEIAEVNGERRLGMPSYVVITKDELKRIQQGS